MTYENIEHCCQLHEHVEIIYVVDGYKASLWTGDGERKTKYESHGSSIDDALSQLNVLLEDVTLEQIRKAGDS